MSRQRINLWVQKFQLTWQVCISVVLGSLAGIYASNVHAFEIETGNEDVVIHWDNTFRYTLADRIRGQSPNIVNSANNDDGDRNFNVGIVSSRLDLLSEFDAVYKKDFGIRFSGAGWYDPIYNGHLDNNSTGTSNHFANGVQALGLNPYTRNLFGGPNGELLDAFVFAKHDFGDIPAGIRVGRHTIYWGEAFFPAAGANGISYAQSPIDMAKALAQPGVELKEIFRPLNQVSAQIQPTKDIVIAAQYYLQWEPNVFPDAGSYLGMVDGLMSGGTAFLLPTGPLFNGGDMKPTTQNGDFGVKVAYSPDWMNATVGLYYRNFTDKMPQVLANAGGYHLSYDQGINLYGISFAKKILGISVGSELSFRDRMPLTSQWFAPQGARGDTMHAVVNFLTLMPQTPLFDSATAIVEFAYGRYDKVTSGAQFFTGMNGYSGLDHATRDNTTVAINFVPQWTQIFPGVDLSMPLNFSIGMTGNAATATGGAQGSGTYSAGLSFDIYAKYRVDLTYASFLGIVHPGPGGQVLPPGLAAPGQGAADPIALLRDRDLLSLTLKATF